MVRGARESAPSLASVVRGLLEAPVSSKSSESSIPLGACKRASKISL